MRRLVLHLLVLAGFFGCSSPDEFVSAEARITGPDRLDFGEIPLSVRSTRSLVVRNEGAASASVRVTASNPFVAEVEELSVPGRSSVELAVSVTPELLGPLEGVLHLDWGKGLVEVRLVAEAVEPRQCEPSDECKTVEFVPGQGCVETYAPDGTPCERPCLEEAKCLEGRCVGRQRNCDDDNPCTRDGCDPQAGCVNVPDPEAACGEQDNPCVVATCDPVDGCRYEPVVDGTLCGEANCDISWVCIGGECQMRKTPELGECGTETPCQPKGTCVNGECIQPSPHPLTLRWSAQAHPGWELRFDGVTGADGRVYWVECGFRACELVSALPPSGGALRASLFSGADVAPRGRMLLAERRLVSTYRRGFVQIRDAFDLSDVVSLDFSTALPETEEERTADAWEVVDLAAHKDLAFALVEAWKGNEPIQGWVVAFRVADGTIEWSRRTDGTFDGLVVDELGRLYYSWLHRDPNFGPPALVSLSRSGTERWRMAVDHGAPVAVASGRLLDGGANVRRLEDGAVEDSLDAILPISSRSAVMDVERGAVFGYPLVPCPRSNELCPLWVPHLISFEPWVRDGIGWKIPVASAESWERSEPVLTDQAALLLVEPASAGLASACKRTYVVREVRLVVGEGEVKGQGFSCELPGKGYGGPAVLHGGYLIVHNTCDQQLEAYLLGEAYQLAPRGWVTAFGGPSRSGRPR